MMIKVLFISALIAATANAGWVWKDDNDNDHGDRFPRMTIPVPQFPNLPNLPNFPPLPQIPPIPNFQSFQVPNIQFPDIKFPEMKFPSTDDIVNHEGPGYTGIAVSQKSDGSTVVVTNKDGVVSKYTVPEKSKESK